MNMDQVAQGVRFNVQIRGNWYTGTILEYRFSSQGDYYQCKCELEAEQVNQLTGQSVKQKWIHPKPIQSYKLRRIGGGPTTPAKYSQTPRMSDADIIDQIAAQLEN